MQGSMKVPWNFVSLLIFFPSTRKQTNKKETEKNHPLFSLTCRNVNLLRDRQSRVRPCDPLRCCFKRTRFFWFLFFCQHAVTGPSTLRQHRTNCSFFTPLTFHISRTSLPRNHKTLPLSLDFDPSGRVARRTRLRVLQAVFFL